MFWFVFAILIFIGGVIVTPCTLSRTIANKFRAIKNYDDRLGDQDIGRFEREDISNHIQDETTSIQRIKRVRFGILIGSLTLSILIIALSVIAVVPTGYTGIKTTFGKVSDKTLSSGINFKLPWQNVINMDNREQKSRFSLEAFSKDIQQVDIQGSININIDKDTAMNLYKDVGTEYVDILVQPRIQEDVKIIIAGYTAEKLVENRQNASDAIYELLKSELAQKGINVISFAIENIDFTDAFESAVEAKQVATQEKQRAQTEQERQTMEMEQKAERDRIQANAAADVEKINADAKAYAVKVEAEAQAEANKKLSESLSEELIKYNMVHQWDGKVPVIQGGNGLSSIINLRDIFGEE